MSNSDAGVQQIRHRLAVSALILFGAFALLALAWGFDSIRTANEVGRNVHAVGNDLSGMSAEEIRSVAGELTTALAAEPVTISVGDTTVASDLGRLGARVDTDALVSTALAARTGGNPLLGPLRWLWSFRSPVELDLPHVVDADTVDAAVSGLIAPQLDGPEPPGVRADATRFVAEPGQSGVVVDPAQLIERIQGTVGAPAPHQFSLTPYPQAPELDLDSVGRVAAELNTATSEAVEVRVLDQATVLEPADLLPLIAIDNTPEGAFWQVDEEALLELLRGRFSLLGDETQQARFIVVQDRPEIVPANETLVCCDEKSAALLRAALLTRSTTPESENVADDPETEPEIRSVELLPVITDGTEGVAELEALGITELVSTFTTNHPCCQNRVVNIQLFADALRGQIILPGETLSLNGVVGERTPEKGYRQAGAISRGELEAQYGGGVSQTTTTTFNAAFFAGLDFVEYQAHSIYFSRYPEGREATISFPRPDLKLQNNTEYGVLLWTDYTPTSITVSMYSTKHIEVLDLGTTTRAQGKCRRVTTTRERIYPDGRTETDTVFAVYRPAEGLDCNGNPSNPDPAPPATAPPATTAPTTAAPTTAPPSTPAPTTATPVPTTAAATPTTTTGSTTSTAATAAEPAAAVTADLVPDAPPVSPTAVQPEPTSATG